MLLFAQLLFMEIFKILILYQQSYTKLFYKNNKVISYTDVVYIQLFF